MEVKARQLGATDFGLSTVKNKRYYVVYGNKKINFGQPGAFTYSDGADINKRNAFRSRHSKIKLKNGMLAYLDKRQPAYWSYNLLW